jgi:hypothetical protein
MCLSYRDRAASEGDRGSREKREVADDISAQDTRLINRSKIFEIYSMVVLINTGCFILSVAKLSL